MGGLQEMKEKDFPKYENYGFTKHQEKTFHKVLVALLGDAISRRRDALIELDKLKIEQSELRDFIEEVANVYTGT